MHFHDRPDMGWHLFAAPRPKGDTDRDLVTRCGDLLTVPHPFDPGA